MPESTIVQRTRVLIKWYLHELRTAGAPLEPDPTHGDVYQELALADLRQRCVEAEAAGDALREQLLHARDEMVSLAIAIRSVRKGREAKNDSRVNEAARRLMRALGVSDL